MIKLIRRKTTLVLFGLILTLLLVIPADASVNIQKYPCGQFTEYKKYYECRNNNTWKITIFRALCVNDQGEEYYKYITIEEEVYEGICPYSVSVQNSK